jgi:raffinose/stachyose/melibiose transport system substrate-binding protein
VKVKQEVFMKMKQFLFMCLLVLFLPGLLFAGGQKPEGEVVLTWPCIWVGQDSKTATIQAQVDQFNAENAGQIRVVIEPQPDYDGYEEKIRTSLTSGQAPDIFTINPTPVTATYYKTDLLLDFTEELEKGGWKNNFNKSNLAATTIDGRTKTLPYEIAVAPVWYNEALFKKAGIASFPKTMDEFWVACEKLKAIGIVPMSQMTGGSNAWTSMLWYTHLIGSFGGPDVWKRKWDDPAFVKAAAILKRMYSDGNTTSDAIGANAGVSSGHYMAERTAMFINGPWFIGRIKADAPKVYEDTMLAPAPKAGDYWGHQAGWLQTSLAAANTDDSRRKAAEIKFLRFLTSPENAKAISLNAGSFLAIEFELGPGDEVDQLQKKFIDITNSAEFFVNQLELEISVDAMYEFGQGIGAMILNDATPEEFVQMLADADK